MDEFLRLPGTKFRFGLDPIIGLIPGLGDTASAIVSALALIQAARRGVPKVSGGTAGADAAEDPVQRHRRRRM